ncbi:ABC transporter ATP-binding protein [candidate division TA06 bacterium DG_78]|uniref:ABC transporter ATP-binding protein n=1 Tax=candidate division TA06 bacterium DG_78 TaxID=1703772 RepID=A0A0S7YIA4_UNCT6|nr:MAG: ABC transporter ATP-binding protein [candidate division TA06 bacterium DG_78]
MIKVEDLAKNFNGLWAVDGISFEVNEGEIFGFLGPNGAGKTTTIRILCTLLQPSRGQAWISGFDVLKAAKEVRRSIGIIFQDPSLDDRLTAYENLKFHAIIYKVPRKERSARIDQVLEMAELKDRRNSLVRYFSGGMKRRLEIARGLLHEPKVLFLDEPTLGLDPQTRNRIWDYLHTLRSTKNITLFLTTHYMDEAENCNRIAVIDYGKIIALDTPNNLKRMVKGDVITVRTENDDLAQKELGEKYQVTVQCDSSGLHFEMENGEEFVPKLLKHAEIPITAVSVRRPTLDDVFLKLTGREIRSEIASDKDQLRLRVRRIRGMT